MDDIFVKRPGTRPSSSGVSDDRAAARRMVQEMMDIVLDENPSTVSLSPDEQRLRMTGAVKPGRGGPRSKEEEDSWIEALEEASRVHDEGFVDVVTPQNTTKPQEAAPIVNGLFAKRQEPGTATNDPEQGDFPGTPPQKAPPPRGMANDLFFKKSGKPEVPPIGMRSDDDDDDDDEVGDNDDAGAVGTGPNSGESGRCWCCFEIVCCRSSLQSRASCRQSPPSRATVAKFGGGGLFITALLAVVTMGLATGCDPDAPFGNFCVLAGPVQWIIAFTPPVLVLSASYCWCRRSYRAKEEAKQESWQHDAEAQKSAAELLDTLAVAPPADRHKYASQAVQVLKDFPDKAVIQHKGCAALEAICRAQRGNVQHVHAAGAVPAILQALDKHPRVRKVQSSGLSALACVAKIGKQQIFDLGGIESILRSMTKFKRDPVVQVSGAMALGALCLSSVQNRRSVARYGGVSILLQALERHLERADVIIAASETLALIGQENAGLQKQLLSALPIIQGIAERYDSAKKAAVSEGGKQAEKKIKDCEVVLRSLRKLEARLAELGEVEEDDAASDVATPRLDPRQEGATVVQENNVQAGELMGRLNKWKK